MRSPVIAFLLCVALLQASGQSVPWVADRFGAVNGIDADIRDMVQDGEGFFWLATNRGLYRFDGVQAAKIYLPVADSLVKRTDNCYDLCFDSSNQCVWIGTDLGLFSYNLRTRAARHFNPNDYYKKKDRQLQASHAVFADRQGAIWAEFGRYGFAQLSADGQLLENFYLPANEKEKAAGMDEKLANTILGISQDPNHEDILWMNARRGLLRFDKRKKQIERFLFYPENKKMLVVANSMTCHYAHPNGCVYVGTWNAGLLKFDPVSGSFSQFLRSGGVWKEMSVNIHRIVSLFSDKTGNLWTDGTGGGSLFDVANERFESLPVDNFRVNYQDRDGNYWEYKSGLRLFHRLKNQGKQFHFPPSFVCGQLSGLPFDSRNREIYLRGLCQDGAFWSLQVDSLCLHRFPLPGDEGRKNFISAYAEGPAGFFVINRMNLELYLRAVNSNRFEKLPIVFPQNVGNLDIACSSNGDVFVTGRTGFLFWLRPPVPGMGRPGWTMTTFTGSASGGSLPHDFHCVSTPTFDSNGRLWMITCNGFCIFSPSDSTFRCFDRQQEDVAHLDEYQYFLSDGRQKMWAAGKGGFGWFDIQRPEAGLQKKYRPTGTFHQETFKTAFFIHGKPWLYTSEDWAEFDPETEKFRYFDFLQVDEVVHLGDGQLLAFEENSFHLMHLDSLRVSGETPKPYVSWFKIFEKPIAMPGSLLSALPLRLRPNENFFSIGFSALASYNTAGIRFAYQLEGINQDWVYPEPGERAVSFTNIEGGDYMFRIKTTDSRGVWLDNVFQLKIHVGTPWYKTWWFRLAVLTLLVSAVYFLMKFRLRQQRILLENQRLQLENERSLRNERDRIAAEMHDDFGSELSIIRFLSLAAREKEPDPEKADRIDRIAAHASQMMEKMADIIWVMNSRNDRLGNFMAYLRRYAAEYLQTHGVRFVMETEGNLEDRKLGGEQRRSLLSAIKECLHNVVKHAGARNVRITVKADEQLEITVEDDGKGFPETLLQALKTAPDTLTGNGLYNISKRMAALGGEAVFENGMAAKVRLRMHFAF